MADRFTERTLWKLCDWWCEGRKPPETPTEAMQMARAQCPIHDADPPIFEDEAVAAGYQCCCPGDPDASDNWRDAEISGLLAEAVAALSELYSLVKGESPGLLDEDRGGCARLALEIEAIIRGKE